MGFGFFDREVFTDQSYMAKPWLILLKGIFKNISQSSGVLKVEVLQPIRISDEGENMLFCHYIVIQIQTKYSEYMSEYVSNV